MTRAGGLTPQAYPYGAVFTRESVRGRQQDGFARTARELEQGLMQVAAGQAVAGMRGSADLGGAILAGRELAQSLRQARAAGRMVVESNPVVLAGRFDSKLLVSAAMLAVALSTLATNIAAIGSTLLRSPGPRSPCRYTGAQWRCSMRPSRARKGASQASKAACQLAVVLVITAPPLNTTTAYQKNLAE